MLASNDLDQLRARRFIVWCAIATGVPACAPLSGGPASAVRPATAEYTIAFASFAPNNSDIFIADRDGGHAHPLMPHAAADYDASFSSNGQWVLFTSHRENMPALATSAVAPWD